MLKPIRNDSTASTIYSGDPAVEIENDSIEDFFMNSISNPSGWRDFVNIKDGQSPAVFVIGVIPPSELNRMQDECVRGNSVKENELYWRSFLCGVREIEGWEGETPKVKKNGEEYVDPKWLESTFVRSLRKVGIEIGMRVWSWNNISDDEIKN